MGAVHWYLLAEQDAAPAVLLTATPWGADKKTLYIVGRGAAWKVQLLTPGYHRRAK